MKVVYLRCYIHWRHMAKVIISLSDLFIESIRRIVVFVFFLSCGECLYAQTDYNQAVMQEVQKHISNKEHDKADSILDVFINKPQSQEVSFAINLLKFWNGYTKIQTCQDVSVIRPYSENGKNAFRYLQSNVNSENAQSANCWASLTAFAEIFNYLSDSIIIDIADFSNIYYSKYNQRDLYSYHTVLQNTYQYYFAKNEWKLAAETMEKYYNTAIEANDSTIRTPISATFTGSALLKAKDYKNAEKWFVDSYKRFQLFNNKSKYRAYCELLSDMSYLYHIQGNNELGYRYAQEACSTNLSNFGENSKEYINALAILSNCEMGLNKPNESLKHLERVVELLDNTNNISNVDKQNYKDKLNLVYIRLNIKKDVTINDSIKTENSVILDATNAYTQGNLQEAISKFASLFDYYESNFNSVDLANFVYVAGSLSNALVSEGKYIESDNVLNKSLDIIQKNGIQSSQIKGLYEAKGLLYFTINNIDMALRWYNQAKQIYDNNKDRGLQYALLTSNLAMCYYQKGELSLAKELLDDAYRICSKVYGDNNKDTDDWLLVLNNIATIYAKTKDYQNAKKTYRTIINIATTPHLERTKALALMNLSEIYWLYEHNFEEAEKTLNQVRKLNTASYVKEMAELNLLLIHCITKKDCAISEISQFNESIKNGMADIFSSFSEAEREDYWTNKSQMLVMLNNLALTTFDNQKVRQMAYDNAIYTKSMLINSERLLKNIAIQSSPETKNIHKYIQSLKNALIAKTTSSESTIKIRDAITQQEKDLISSIPDIKEKLKEQFKSFADVKSMLSDDDAALEFVFLPRIKTPFEDSELQYGALIITKNCDAPILVPLCTEYELEGLFDNDNPNSQTFIDSLYYISDTRLYSMIWNRIEPTLQGIKSVYYSPTGYLSKINLMAISNGNQRLFEKYNIHEVSSTAMIENVKQNKKAIRNAMLFGDINYFEDSEMMTENAKKYKAFSSGNILATRSSNRGSWDLLPGTKEEISYINGLMKEKGVNSQVIDGDLASEESFKALNENAPDIIHVATHGFYYSPEEDITPSFFESMNSYTQKDYSLFFSGLLFAGANNAWTGQELSYGVEDGILTTDEISRINLEGNKIVVLSACDTGLGDIDKVDGIFGLQRGFKKAGASTILMSLWKVPDEETCILMKHFYQNLLSGKSAHQSLINAQMQLIRMNKTPYYWAGFILLD